MARFMVVHNTPPRATQEEIIEGARAVMASLPPETKWLNSWVSPEGERLFCEWEAPNAEIIRTCLKATVALFPIESLHEVQWVDPKWYK